MQTQAKSELASYKWKTMCLLPITWAIHSFLLTLILNLQINNNSMPKNKISQGKKKKNHLKHALHVQFYGSNK